MKHPLDIIEDILSHSGGEARKEMQNVLKDKLAYMEEIAKRTEETNALSS